MRRDDPAIEGLMELIRKEGISSRYLSLSCAELYEAYEPLQEYTLDLNRTKPKNDYKTFSKFWQRLKSSLRKELKGKEK